MNPDRLLIIDGVRTPFCKAGSDLASRGADELGRIAVNACSLAPVSTRRFVDEVIFGCVAQTRGRRNVARVIALRAGIPNPCPP